MTLDDVQRERAVVALEGVDGFLVTGAGGFIGRHLVDGLRSLGKRVTPLSHSADFDVMRDDLPLEGIRHVFHLAGLLGVVRAWEDPLSFIATNTCGTARVLDQCRRSGCSATFLSSYVYRSQGRRLARESDPVDPQNPYAFSKHLGEETCRFYHKYYGLGVVVLRLANIYGPGQSTDYLIPHIVTQVVDPAVPEIQVQDLEPSRDYLHVSDAVTGILMSTRAEPGAVFNLASGQAHSVEEIILSARSAAQVTKPYRATAMKRRNEISWSAADITAIRSALGWQPVVSLDAGLRTIVDSLRQPCGT